VSNEIVHEMDILPTLAHIAGAEVPKDRIIDGVDQSNFLMGKTDKSPREGFVVYVGNDIYGVKWRNWKVMSKEVDKGGGDPVRSYGIPLFYNLYNDPKEEHPEDPRMNENLWVRFPTFQILNDHIKSLQQEPPIRPGTPDPVKH
jgi:arylsulfatase A-like enzyme